MSSAWFLDVRISNCFIITVYDACYSKDVAIY